MYKRILLSLDGSALAEQALPHAIVQAERCQTELVLLKVLEPLQIHGLVRPSIEWVKKQTTTLAYEYLERVAAKVKEHNIPVQVVVIEGHTPVEIVRFAEANEVDLIVMCTRGHSGFSRWLLGSVADRVVRGASVPVLLVRARKGETYKARDMRDGSSGASSS
jgi:nucleotide-binding universal stress UspA family protein